MFLSTNGRCTVPPPHNSQRIVQVGPPARGELFMVCAAMKHPFLEHINNSGLTIRTYQSTALGSQHAQSPWRDGVKPCIVGAGATDKAGAQVYLIQRITPERMADLPALMRHYLIPIHAIHSDQPSDSSAQQYGTYHEHLHTSPSWAEGADHWVLGLACEVEDGAMLRRCQRSPTNSPVDRAHYYVDCTIMQKFEDLCAAKDEEWNRKPRQERENGVVQLIEWNTQPHRKPRKISRDLGEESSILSGTARVRTLSSVSYASSV
ncbi:hypothetical protein FIBSPDRAFT_589643 [Athelia psychrophila]|uniref:Uncharacterized protein n=1 Tax=Athelia psychrophila TaxID=1759441 RepID=A0A166H7T7_9AGAM|nr:hypothetical protein FIBSPDRAFT_589643 [Fibularhizoctonia sp. CBS 109695]